MIANRAVRMLIHALVCAGMAGASAATSQPAPSLFRSLLGPSQQVPFPLPSLLSLIGSRLAADSARFDGLPLVLIPLGRSLQRHAAGVDGYFRYPRVVVAVTGEPRDTAAPLLRDRLYLGYHEKAGVLEVISYNPGLGRFEFELVDDYRAGGSPRLRAGNRSLCLACHQNAAPMFARQSWDETSASRSIAGLLALTGRDYYGLSWRRGVDVAEAIDDATHRANLLSVAQRVWQQGCGGGAAGRACRARLWWLALQSRLSGWAPADDELRQPALSPLRDAWLRHWPEGIEVPNPDIPNRLPFASLAPGALTDLDTRALRRAADVSEAFDPLALREPLARWRLDEPGALARVVDALAGFVSPVELDALAAASRRADGGRQRDMLLDCRWRERAQSSELRCAGGGGVQAFGRLSGRRLRIDRLVLAAGRVRYGLEFEGRDRHFDGHGAVARDFDGSALVGIERAGEQLRLLWLDDLAPLREAVAEAARGDGDDGGFGDGPLERRRLLAPLLARFGLPAPPEPVALPALAGHAAGVVPSEPAEDGLLPFYRHCAACHESGDAFPPDFLGGSRERVSQRVEACAPRMLRRLAMWQVAAGRRGKTPMPPPASVQAAGFAASEDLVRMRDFLEARLRAVGQAPERIAAMDYADLPACAQY